MVRILLLVGLLISCAQPSRQITQNDAEVDSLLNYLRENINPLYHTRNTMEVRRRLDSVQPSVERLQNFTITCTWLRMRAVLLDQLGQTDSALVLIQQAMELATQQDTTNREVLAAKIQLASILGEKQQLDSAIHLAEESFYLASKIDTPGLPFICIRLFELHFETGNLSAARRYLNEGLRRNPLPRHRAILLHNLASYYDAVNYPDSTIMVLKRIEGDSSLAGSPSFNAGVTENIGVWLTRQEKYSEALPYFLKSLNITRRANIEDPVTHFNIATTYRSMNRFTESNAYLDTALPLAVTERDAKLERKIWYTRGSNFMDLKQYGAAAFALDTAYNMFHVELDSSIFRTAKEIETRYEVKAKNDQIQSLAAINSINEKARAQQRLFIYGLVICLVLVIIIGILMVKRKNLRLQLKEASLKQQLLRSQMEPHYIFNTMSVAQSFIRSGDLTKSSDYIGRFASLLRISLENARQNFVPLTDEIIALESYIALQSMEAPGAFSYQLNTFEGFEEDGICIPPMLIQPFVENAILHGMQGIPYKGELSITIQREGEILRCEIEDNGRGLSAANTGEGKRSLSTLITRERLELLGRQTGKSATLQVIDKQKNESGSGIKVILHIPIQFEPQPLKSQGVV